jgi:hypothetical protein
MLDENRKYSYSINGFLRNLIQEYIYDVILIANSNNGLQKIIYEVEAFYKFSDIKSNPKKYELFGIRIR